MIGAVVIIAMLVVSAVLRASAADTTRLFGGIVPSLKAVTSQPIMLPTYLPGVNSSGLYVTNHDSTAVTYMVAIGVKPGCGGEHACDFGWVVGSTKSLPTTGGIPKTLANGMRAHFIRGQCAAYCLDNSLVWAAGGHFYEVDLKGGSPKDLVRVANSMKQY